MFAISFAFYNTYLTQQLVDKDDKADGCATSGVPKESLRQPTEQVSEPLGLSLENINWDTAITNHNLDIGRYS